MESKDYTKENVDKMKEMIDGYSSHGLHNLDDLAVYYKMLVRMKKFSEARTIILGYFAKKIVTFDNYDKAVKVYNKEANRWNKKHKLMLPIDFVKDAFDRRNFENAN